jgi:ABC-2 type transport system permease protein
MLPLFVLQIILPMDLEHFLAVGPQFISMYLLCCMLANWLSLLGPMPIAAGTMKPTNVKLWPVLMQVLFIFLLPVALSPTLLPLGIEYWLQNMGWDYGLPVCLIAALILCAAICLAYRLMLTWQGHVLQELELNILRIITTKAE